MSDNGDSEQDLEQFESRHEARDRLKEARIKNPYGDHGDLERAAAMERYDNRRRLDAVSRARNAAKPPVDERQRLVNAIEAAQATYEQAEKALNVWETKDALLTSKKAQGEHVSLERVEFVRQKIHQLNIPFRKAEKRLAQAEDVLYRHDNAAQIEQEKIRQQYAALAVYGITEAQARAAEQMRRDRIKSHRQRMQQVDRMNDLFSDLAQQIAVEQGPEMLERLNAGIEREKAARGIRTPTSTDEDAEQ